MIRKHGRVTVPVGRERSLREVVAIVCTCSSDEWMRSWDVRMPVSLSIGDVALLERREDPEARHVRRGALRSRSRWIVRAERCAGAT